MANRFVQGIRSGDIDSLEDLKTAFKELAKATHPDLAGAGSGDEFLAVRSEYENALHNFEHHRFGAAKAGAAGGQGERGATVASGELWACLALFLKRGFPKTPRHEKEILRYEYARWRLRGALRTRGREGAGADPVALYDAFEAECLATRKALPEGVGAAVAFLRNLVAHAEREHPAMRTSLVRDLGDLRLEPGLGGASLAFLEFMAGELGIGKRLG
ncbi:MAG: hypothetical protein WCL50_05935 [Spirochaetota bacterium]